MYCIRIVLCHSVEAEVALVPRTRPGPVPILLAPIVISCLDRSFHLLPIVGAAPYMYSIWRSGFLAYPPGGKGCLKLLIALAATPYY